MRASALALSGLAQTVPVVLLDDPLTSREADVIRLRALGMTYREIGLRGIPGWQVVPERVSQVLRKAERKLQVADQRLSPLVRASYCVRQIIPRGEQRDLRAQLHRAYALERERHGRDLERRANELFRLVEPHAFARELGKLRPQ